MEVDELTKSILIERPATQDRGLPLELRAAWEASGLSSLPPHAQHALIETGVTRVVPAGEPVPVTSPDSWVRADLGNAILLIDGLIRIFVRFGERQVTVQYASDSSIFGIAALEQVDRGRGFSVHGQALLDSHIFVLDTNTLQSLLETDIDTALLAVNGMRESLYESISLLAEHVLWPLRQRVARHLLDMAVRHNGAVVVPATVQSIADATGTVRAVVTRLLKSMRAEGLITRSSGFLVLLAPRAMHEVARGNDSPREDRDCL